MVEIEEIDEVSLVSDICKESFFEFVKEFWFEIIPEEPVYNWHIEHLCLMLQDYGFRVSKRLPKNDDFIINIPPGTTKSTIVTVMFPAWLWAIDPTLRVLTASYSSSLSTDHSIKSRDIIKSDRYKELFPDVEIKHDQDNKTHYKNTKGGERYATSVGGTVTGFHAHVILVDDPINPKGAASDAERETANNFMDITLSTRKVNKDVTFIGLIMQRLHQKDPTGNWLGKKGKKINHICLPAELSQHVKPPELKEMYVDGLLDPVRLSKDVLEGLAIDLGSYGYAGQMGQTPTPEGGGTWQRWIIPVDDHLFPVGLKDVGTDWDLAYTKNDKNSASAFVTAGMLDDKMYIDNIGFKWLEFPALVEYMKENRAPHYIEGKASGKSAKQTLDNMGIAAIEVQVDGGDKVARTKLATPFAEAKRIYCRASLLDKLYNHNKQGILLFPNNENDDLNDALVQSINRLMNSYKFNFVVL